MIVLRHFTFAAMKHEEKRCPRCNTAFECKVGSVNLCQCSTVKLSDAERSYLRENFSDCLCADCMRQLRSEFHFKTLNEKLKHLFRKITG
jgi:hypothetical protein